MENNTAQLYGIFEEEFELDRGVARLRKGSLLPLANTVEMFAAALTSAPSAGRKQKGSQS
ncbi:hypothetical protein SAMN04488557_3800 [Hyphomicrobium facile]|uniref:Uncharacterized protein n=1 Tax=Hyphomicrobium facile TaxID=51670 RepID=A0A1I7NVL1_9HYPH|nr:hypothetical protein SAMN04488557_3800 [Hyphomicrobium facile]